MDDVERADDAETLRLWPPWTGAGGGIELGLLYVDDRARVGPTRSVRICLWNRVPVAASESMGISSLTWTVCAC